jgi:hypothetical protein
MIECTFNREIGLTPTKTAMPCAVRRIAPPHLFRRRNTQFELSYNKPYFQELLVP